MQEQHYISIQRCPLGFWHSLPQATALQTVNSDLFKGRMEKVYPYHRSRCIHT